MEDREIVTLYWARDERAIRETAKKYTRYCRSIAYHILYDREESEEVVNSVLFHAWNSMPPHRPENLSTFLGKLTRCAALKKWRERHTAKRGGGESALVYEELSTCIPAEDDPETVVETKALAELLDRFLTALPSTERRVFVCRYWYFDSIASLCEQFGFGESRVKSMLFRTRKKLKNYLEREGIDLVYRSSAGRNGRDQ